MIFYSALVSIKDF